MKTLHLYILKEVIPPILLSGAFFTFILFILRIFDFADMLLRAGVSGGLLGKFLLVVIATIISLTIPMAVLMGVLIGVGRLTSENEVLAMRVAGVSIPRAFYPVFLLAALISGGMMWGNATFFPEMFQRIRATRHEIQFNLLTRLEPGRFYGDLGSNGTDITLYYEARDPDAPAGAGLAMRDVSMRLQATGAALYPEQTELTKAQRAKRQELLIMAESGVIQGNAGSRALAVSLKDGVFLPLMDADSEALTSVRFGELQYQIGDDEGEEEEPLDEPRELSLRELTAHLASPPEGPAYREENGSQVLRGVWKRHYSGRNDLIRRFTMPLSALAFALIAVPLAIETRPRAKSFAFLIAAGLMLAYYVMMTFASRFGSSGGHVLLAIAALMLPNVVIGGTGLWLLIRVNRR